MCLLLHDQSSSSSTKHFVQQCLNILVIRHATKVVVLPSPHPCPFSCPRRRDLRSMLTPKFSSQLCIDWIVFSFDFCGLFLPLFFSCASAPSPDFQCCLIDDLSTVQQWHPRRPNAPSRRRHLFLPVSQCHCHELEQCCLHLGKGIATSRISCHLGLSCLCDQLKNSTEKTRIREKTRSDETAEH